jgi:L-cysteine:1D-myo-inositol 2-amino-2-deoxy-alpha-D-glucopyranoside ligase
MAIRLALLAHHYRSDWEWRDEDLALAERRLASWRAAVARTSTPAAGPLITELRTALADDLDAPTALAAMDRWAAESGEEPDGADAQRVVDALLGVAL